MAVSFEYTSAPINSLKVVSVSDKGTVTRMDIDGRIVTPTNRFWTSICSNFSTSGLSMKLFKMFTHAEVFERLAQKHNESVRLTIAKDDSKREEKLLAISKPDKGIAKYETVTQILAENNAKDVQYVDQAGIVRSWHTPPRIQNLTIGGDTLVPQYVMETPIDGFGKPLIYLSLLRQVCSNGMIGYARAFRTELSIGKNDDVTFAMQRALESYSNEEGYMAIQQRLDAAMNSWASVNEVNTVAKALSKITFLPRLNNGRDYNGWIDELELNVNRDFESGKTSEVQYMGMRMQKALSSLSGDICHIYGIVQVDALSQRRMATMPARCTVYDLMNYLTEVATHYCDQDGSRRLQSILGTLLSSEYDLENSRASYKDFADWNVANSDEADVITMEQQAKHTELAELN